MATAAATVEVKGDATPPPARWTLKRVALVTLLAAAICFGLVLAFQLRNVFLLIFAGIVISTAVKPLILRIRNWGLSHSIAVCLVFGVLIAAGVLLLTYALPMLAEQTLQLIDSLPKAYATIRNYLDQSSFSFISGAAVLMPAELPKDLSKLFGLDSPDSVSTAMDYGNAVVHSLLNGLAILLLAFYWSLNDARTIRAATLLLPLERREHAREMITAMQEKLGDYIRGQLALCGVVGLLFLLMLWFLGVPYAIPLAIAAAVLEAIPILGPVLGSIPAVLVALAVSPSLGLAVAVAATIIQTIEGNILVPRVMEKAVGLSAVATLLAIIVFGSLCGLLGAALAIPLAALGQLVLQRLVLNSAPAVTTGRDSNALARHQLQELMLDVRKQLRNREQSAVQTDTTMWEEEIESIARALDNRLSALDTAAKNQPQTELT